MPAPAKSDTRPPRIAILGFSIECNRFAPVATEAHFAYFAGDGIVAEARLPAPRMLGEIPGFVADMDAAGPWQPVGIAFAAAEPNGPVDHAFFTRLMADIDQRLPRMEHAVDEMQAGDQRHRREQQAQREHAHGRSPFAPK